MTTKTTVPNNLFAHRKQAGLLQSDVAKALGLDCINRISRWERGIAMPSVANLFKLARLYGVKPEELYNELFNQAEVELEKVRTVFRGE